MTPVILCDTEYTTFDDPAWRGGYSANPDPNVPREIVQIGALKLDPQTLVVLDAFELLVKPRINPQLSDYFIGLSGITQAMVDAVGVDFTEAYPTFNAFMGDAFRFVSYGNDWAIITLNLKLNAMPVPDITATNLHGWFHSNAPQTKGVNSGRLAETVGARPTKGEHTALADCHSIRDAMLLLIEQGVANPFI